MDLKSKLNTAKNISNGQPVSERRIQRKDTTTFTGSVESLDNEVFGESKLMYDDGGRPVYNAEEEMKRIQQGFNSVDLSNCKLPNIIKESIMNQPLISTSVDPKMDSFTEALAKKIPGAQKVTSIINQLEEEDKKKNVTINESIQHGTAQQIDYDLIKNIVNECVKSLKNELKNELNESIYRNRSNDTSVKVMKMTDKFLFLDSDDNIFECQMIYKGKKKKK